MKRFLSFVTATLVFSVASALVAGSIVINDQPAQAKHAVNNP